MKKILCILFILLFVCTNNIFSISVFQKEKLSVISSDTTKKNLNSKIDSTSLKKRIALKPLMMPSLLNKSLRVMNLRKSLLEATDYRTAADFFSNIPFGFVRDLGALGQPNEVIIFGNGYANISFLDDGISINNRFSNSLNLNSVQSESIDSIEVIPIVRGFIYGGTNNPIAVNIISREPNFKRPYSKIKFYQAPNSEGLIDAIFCLNPVNKLNTYFEITNQSTDPYYNNTDYGIWIGNIRLRYLLSENFNILATYRHYNSKTQLNGGVDVDSIPQAFPTFEIEDIIYDRYRAPVRFTNRNQEITGNNFNIRLLGNFIDKAPTNLSLYYQTDLEEYRQNEDGSLSNTATIIHDNESKTFGMNLRQDLSFSFGKLTSLTNYERLTLNSPLLETKTEKTYFSQAALAELSLFDDSFVPVLFGKYLNTDNTGYLGFGADLIVQIIPSLKMFAGISSFEKPLTIYEQRFILPSINPGKQKIKSFEISAAYLDNQIKSTLSFFSQSNNNTLMPAIIGSTTVNDKAFYYSMKDITLQGINLKFALRIWKLLLISNTSYYLSESSRHDFNIPDMTSQGGIYYVDTLFNNNLKLKAGINYYSYGNRDYTIIDFEKNISSNYIYNPTNGNTSLISSSYAVPKTQFDFFLSGRIQKSAIIYFVFENLLNEKYSIAPYYPKQSRGLRFGLAWEFLD